MARLGIGGNLEDDERGAEAEGGRSFGTIQDVFQDLGGARREVNGLFVPDEGLFANGELYFTGEGGNGAAPIADGVAMDTYDGGGVRDGGPFGQEGEDVVLFGR
jgi:hypothetical protein